MNEQELQAELREARLRGEVERLRSTIHGIEEERDLLKAMVQRERDEHNRSHDSLSDRLTRVEHERDELQRTLQRERRERTTDRESVKMIRAALGVPEGSTVIDHVVKGQDADIVQLKATIGELKAKLALSVMQEPGIYVATRPHFAVRHPLTDAVVVSGVHDGQWMQAVREKNGNLSVRVHPVGTVVGFDRGSADGDVTCVMIREKLEACPTKQHMDRLDRLEAWAKQFPRTHVTPYDQNGAMELGWCPVKPLEEITP